MLVLAFITLLIVRLQDLVKVLFLLVSYHIMIHFNCNINFSFNIPYITICISFTMYFKCQLCTIQLLAAIQIL